MLVLLVSVGELSEWFKVQSWKGCVVQATMSSNLILSAICLLSLYIKAFFNIIEKNTKFLPNLCKKTLGKIGHTYSRQEP